MFNKSKIFVACFAITALTAFGIGCGDDGDDNGGGAYTSIDGSAELGSLSTEDDKQLCEDGVSYAKSNAPNIDKQKSCNFNGNAIASATFFATPDLDAAKAACESAVTNCMEAEDEAPVDETDPCATPTDYPETCTATVDEFVACQKDNFASAEALFANVKSCADLTEADLTADEPSEEDPSGPCVTFDDKCGL